MTDSRMTRLSRRALLAGSAAIATLIAAPAIVRAQGGPLKVGVLLPRSGSQASIGQDCHRGAEMAPAILKDSACRVEIMNADTETNVEVARARAEKLISDGAQLLVGAFDSGQTTAIAQVAEQKGIPLVINIAAAPPITEQGYKFVFRNFPTDADDRRQWLRQSEGAVRGQRQDAQVGGVHARQRHVRQAMKNGSARLFRMPACLSRSPRPSPMIRPRTTSRSRSSKAKATGAEALLVVTRLNDAIMLIREMVKQRWSPMGVLSPGPGRYEDQYLKTLGKLSDGRSASCPGTTRTRRWARCSRRRRPRLSGASIVNTNTASPSRRC